jgi:hypothetical protein
VGAQPCPTDKEHKTRYSEVELPTAVGYNRCIKIEDTVGIHVVAKPRPESSLSPKK